MENFIAVCHYCGRELYDDREINHDEDLGVYFCGDCADEIYNLDNIDDEEYTSQQDDDDIDDYIVADFFW